MEKSFTFPGGMLRIGERGDRVPFRAEMRNDGRGLYKVWIQGAGGRLELGTLTPEGPFLTLSGSISQEKLQSAGCWPPTAGGVTLVHRFGEEKTKGGWRREERPARLFPKDDTLRAEADHLGACLISGGDGEFRLAAPFQYRRPFPMPSLFCFTNVERISGQSFAVFRFAENGRPLFPTERVRKD